jgi:hypothetical protein
MRDIERCQSSSWDFVTAATLRYCFVLRVPSLQASGTNLVLWGLNEASLSLVRQIDPLAHCAAAGGCRPCRPQPRPYRRLTVPPGQECRAVRGSAKHIGHVGGRTVAATPRDDPRSTTLEFFPNPLWSEGLSSYGSRNKAPRCILGRGNKPWTLVTPRFHPQISAPESPGAPPPSSRLRPPLISSGERPESAGSAGLIFTGET